MKNMFSNFRYLMALSVFCFGYLCACAQSSDNLNKRTISFDVPDEFKKYIPNNFTGHWKYKYSTCVDKLWMFKITNNPISTKLSAKIPARQRNLSKAWIFVNNTNEPLFSTEKLYGGYKYDWSSNGKNATKCNFKYMFYLDDFSIQKISITLDKNNPPAVNSKILCESEYLETSNNINRKILSFAKDSLGKKIGDGECTTLAVKAMDFANTQPSVGYIWGKLIAKNSLEHAKPGDIIQFDNAKFEFKGGGYKTAGDPNHTAVIKEVSSSHNKIDVYEQNVTTPSRVKESTYDFNDLTRGNYFIYRSYQKCSDPDLAQVLKDF